MKTIWNGDILLSDQKRLSDINLSSIDNGDSFFQPKTPLRFLSIVNTAQIPLHMTVGRPYLVNTSSFESLAWFSNVLLGGYEGQDLDEPTPWWKSAQADSPLGVLIAVDDASMREKTTGPKVTELLIFATREEISQVQRPPTPPQSSPFQPGPETQDQGRLVIQALPLSSDLLIQQIAEPTPPSSPSAEGVDIVEARFLPSVWDEPVHEPPVKKRRSAAEAFDEAEERRRKARRKGGQGVSAAAALQKRPDDAMPTLQHRRTVSGTQVPLQTRPLSRSSSIASARPTSKREPSVPAISRPSALSHSQSAPAVPQAPEAVILEEKNREFVKKMIMAAMRMKGLKQSKSRRSRANSNAASPAIDATFDELDAERKNDEEYKNVFNQVYKGVCFTFRQHIATVDLQTHIGAIDDVVTQLLGLFLQDPLSKEVDTVEDEFTPGGRKLFGSSAVRGASDQNPFLQAAVAERDSRNNTPCGRKGAGLDNAVTLN